MGPRTEQALSGATASMVAAGVVAMFASRGSRAQLVKLTAASGLVTTAYSSALSGGERPSGFLAGMSMVSGTTTGAAVGAVMYGATRKGIGRGMGLGLLGAFMGASGTMTPVGAA